MIPNNVSRGVRTGGNADSTAFGISRADEVHIMGILRDQLYSDKVLAVLREYASNAWDANRMAGKGDVPIEVTLPTYGERTLVIRDHGPGMSHEDVFQVYTQYGASTKRGDDVAVGMLGIGSKSGFAYSDSFTVTSFHGGKKRVYVAVLDESDRGLINLAHEEDSDETGIEIRIAVRAEDISEFQQKARVLFQYFEPRPTINVDLPPQRADRTTLPNGTIWSSRDSYGYSQSSDWIAVMGCVPYRVNIDQLPEEDLGDIAKSLPNLSGVLQFSIGELQIAASREDLKYSKLTKTALVQKIHTVIDEYVVHTLTQIEQNAQSAWDKRIQLQTLLKLDLTLPELWEEFTHEHVKLVYETDDFTLIRNRSATNTVGVNHDTKLYIDDTNKDPAGYQLSYHHYIVRAAAGKTVDHAITALNAAVTVSKMDGIPIVRLSTLTWTEPYDPKKKKKKRIANPKHRAKMFRLIPRDSKFEAPFSDHWEVQDRVPTDEDVFVLTAGFKALNDAGTDVDEGFFRCYLADRELIHAVGGTMPEIYAYKSTEKKPADVKALSGRPYSKWRLSYFKSLMTPERIAQIQKVFWSRGTDDIEYSYYYHERALFQVPDDRKRELIRQLGRKHPIVRYVTARSAATKAILSWKNKGRERMGALLKLALLTGFKFSKSAMAAERKKLIKTYPLMAWFDLDASGILQEKQIPAWCQYIKLIDQTSSSDAQGVDQPVEVANIFDDLFDDKVKDNDSDDDSDDDSDESPAVHADA